MKNKLAFAVLAAIFSIALGVAASAQMPGGGEGAPNFKQKGMMNRKQLCPEASTGMDIARLIRRPNLAKDLAITPEQAREMKDKLEAARLRLEDAIATTCEASETLENAALGEAPDHSEIYRMIDDLTYAKQDMMKLEADLLIEIYKTLTPEQWAALREMAADARKQNGKGNQKNKNRQ